MPQRPDRDNDDDEEHPNPRNSAPFFANRPLAHLHKFYLVGTIKDPEHYVQWFEIMRNAKENDLVYIHINSPGGNLWTTLQMIRAMGECAGTLVVSVEGMCLSAATMIFLNAPKTEISAHSMFMIHNYSGMVMGKGGEIADQVKATTEWSAALMNDIYRDFLTKEEIDSVLNSNKDLWLTGQEVITRMQKKYALRREREELAEKAKTAKPAEPEPVVTMKKKRKKKESSGGEPGLQGSALI